MSARSEFRVYAAGAEPPEGGTPNLGMRCLRFAVDGAANVPRQGAERNASAMPVHGVAMVKINHESPKS